MLDDYRLLHFLRQEKYLLSLQLKKRRKDLLDHLRRLKLKKKALNWRRYVLQADPVFQR